jgi:hypothetical protein
MRSRGEGEFSFIEVQRPQGDAWPYSQNELAEMAVIFACVKPGLTNISVSTIDFDRTALARLDLTLKGEEPVILMEQAATMTAKKYDGTIDGMAIGSFYVNDTGQLVAADLPGNVRAELVVNVEG